MIKNRKNKIILGLLAGAAVISLASVGFAQWQIGLVKNEENKNIDVAVDTFSEETCYLNVTTATNAKINLGEVKAIDKGTGIGYEVVTNKEANLQITITDFTLAISNSNKDKIPSLTFKLSVDTESTGKSLTTTIADGDVFERTGVGSYIGLEQTITLENFTKPSCFTLDESVKGYNIYKLNDNLKTFNFKWGSVFGNTADTEKGLVTSGTYTPASFYQEKITAAAGDTEEALKNQLRMLTQVQKDLTAMHSALDGAKLKLTINFGFSGK